MKKLLLILAAVCIAHACYAAADDSPEPAKESIPLRDGFTFGGVDGVLTKAEDSDTWFFAPHTDVSDGRGTVQAGQKLCMLPSAVLEKITADAGENASLNVKLWARITRYCNRYILLDKLPSRKFINRKVENKSRLDSEYLRKNLVNKNYLFAIYYVPMTNVEPEKTQQPPADEANGDKTDTGVDSILPDDVLKELTPKRVVNLNKLKEAMETKTDVVLADRTGFVVIDDNNKVFTIDALGRNVEDISFELLSCEALENAERDLLESPLVRQRFRVSGIVTTYKGQGYMLLQRITRTYSHGNFAR